MHCSELNKALGNIDLYLLDQILKGRFENKTKLLDAGCGEGRNLRYFVNNDFDVYGLDSNALAIQMAQMTYKTVPKQNWKTGLIEKIPWSDENFDAIICNAVLHFADDETHFFNMMRELERVLKPSGILFIRTASTIGLKSELPDSNGFTYRLTAIDLQSIFEKFRLSPIEPFKTVLVDNNRSMATLILVKS